ncbi:MAG: LysM peptidoglycan-binding domain-containing protein [Planctomycetaceae bacterium]|nr:LysM peptidoglycan-binding domain-containing protein [Planctomycetaceae bacterium]
MKRFKITFTKSLFFVVILFFVVAGVKSVFFPPRPANVITDDERKLLDDLGIKTNGNDGGDVSPAFGTIDFGKPSTDDLVVPASSSDTPPVFKDGGAPVYANDAAPAAFIPAQSQVKPFDEPVPFAPIPVAPTQEINDNVPVPVTPLDETNDAPSAPSLYDAIPFVMPADKPLLESSSNTSPFSSGNSTPLALPTTQTAVVKPLPRITDSRVAMNLPQRAVLPVPTVDAPSPPMPVAPPPVQDNATSTTAHINPIRPSDAGFSPFLADVNKISYTTNSPTNPPATPAVNLPATVPTTAVPNQEYHRTSIRTDSVVSNIPAPVVAQPISNESALERFKSFNSNQSLTIPSAVPYDSSSTPETTPPSISFSATPPLSSLISFDNGKTNVNANIIDSNTITNNAANANQLQQPTAAVAPNMPQPNIARPRIQPAPAAMPKLRDSVVQYVKAQCVLIDSGSAKAIREGYSQLSQLVRHSELNDEERQYLMPMLNQLAHDVIFTPNIHVLELPYRVGQSDTIESIANQFDLPPSVLMRINGLTNLQTLIPGSEIKVVYGPFDVHVSRRRGEIWLILNGLYAGCYKLFNNQTINLAGDFPVVEKRLLGANNDIPWIDLGNGIGLISTKEMRSNPGSSIILVQDKAMPELYELITVKSRVTIE